MELRARVFRLEDLLIMSTQPAQGVNIMRWIMKLLKRSLFDLSSSGRNHLYHVTQIEIRRQCNVFRCDMNKWM